MGVFIALLPSLSWIVGLARCSLGLLLSLAVSCTSALLIHGVQLLRQPDVLALVLSEIPSIPVFILYFPAPALYLGFVPNGPLSGYH